MDSESKYLVNLTYNKTYDFVPELLDLAIDIEAHIRSRCYNPNSYDGWAGTWGQHFIYPVCVSHGSPDSPVEEKGYSLRNRAKTPMEFCTAKCKFGSNHLLTGMATLDILEYLESTYGLDFAALERERLTSLEESDDSDDDSEEE